MVQIEACQAKGDSQCVRDPAPPCSARFASCATRSRWRRSSPRTRSWSDYLNIAYYGEEAYGVEAAARHYFSTKAAKLSLAQAAMLAGLVQNPDSNNPVNNPSAALDRRDVVLNRMVELKLITLDQATQAKEVGFDEKKIKTTRNGCVGTRYPFLCDYVRRTLLNSPSLGKTEDDRENMINRGGAGHSDRDRPQDTGPRARES